jgi:ribose transport system permease protein
MSTATITPSSSPQKPKRKLNLQAIGIYIAAVALFLVLGLLNSQFLTPGNLRDVAVSASVNAIIGIGLTFVIITGGIDLSVGSIFALLGVIFIDMIGIYMVPWPLAFLLTALGGVVLGGVHAFLVTKMKMQPFVVTLCGLLIYRGLARWYTDDGTAGFEFGQSFPGLELLTTGRTYGVPHSFVAFIIVAVIMGVVLHRSVFGRYLFAVGKNEEAARYSGIDSRKVIAAAYVISGLLAGISTVYFAMYTRSISPASHGNFYELYAIAAAVLGGCSLRGGEGSVLGIVLGAVLLQILQNLVNLLGIPSSLNCAVMGGVILIGVIADQQLVRYRTKKANARKRSLGHGALSPAAQEEK